MKHELYIFAVDFLKIAVPMGLALLAHELFGI